MIKVTNEPKKIDEIKNLDNLVEEFTTGMRPIPCEVELEDMHAMARCIREVIMHEFRQINYYSFEEISSQLSRQALDQEIMDNYINTVNELNRLNLVEEKIWNMEEQIRWK